MDARTTPEARIAPSATWPEAGEPYAAVAETHTSVVLLLGDRAYKVKKPVTFPFVDLGTRQAREADCRREVALNRRLAPDVYLGVGRLGLTGAADAGGPEDEPVVVMRRMPAARRLSTLAAAGADVTDAVRDAARRVARMHADLPPLTVGRLADAVGGLWREGFAQLAPFTGTVLDADVLAEAERLALTYVAGRGPLFASREHDGRVRDGHGDLLAEDVFCLDDGVRILDCLEFDPRLRVGDVLADVAFLVMDLDRLGRPDLARLFADTYAELAGETHPRSLEHHYVAYRAFVRAKVECLRAAQHEEAARYEEVARHEEAARREEGPAPPADPARAGRDVPGEARARALLDLAVRHLRAGRVRLVLVGGLPGSGKTTLAAELARRSGDPWVLVRSDVVRKEQAGLEATSRAEAPYGTGLYDAAHTAAAYEELLRRARVALERGCSVVLDASWSSAPWRTAARDLGHAVAAEVVEVRADASPEVCARRLQRRRTRGGDASDATVDVLVRMSATADVWPQAVPVDTTAPLEESLAALRRAVD